MTICAPEAAPDDTAAPIVTLEDEDGIVLTDDFGNTIEWCAA